MFGFWSKKKRDENQAAAYAGQLQSGVRNKNLQKELFDALHKGHIKTAEQIVLLGTTDNIHVLMYFCSRKNQDAVSFLLSSGTPPTDEALKTAIEKGHSDITRLLIQYGASKDRGGEFLTAVSKNFNARQICNILAALDAAPIKKIEPQTAPPSPDEVVIESQLAGQSRREIYDFKRQERWTFFGKGVPPLCEKFNQLGHKDEGLKAAIAKHNKLGGKYTVDSILCPYKEITVSRLGRVPGGF